MPFLNIVIIIIINIQIFLDSIPGVNMVPCGSWVNAPKEAYILGLKELPFSGDPISQTHIFFAHAYKVRVTPILVYSMWS